MDAERGRPAQAQDGKGRSDVGVRNVTPLEIDRVIDVLARAFDEDPVVNFLVRRDNRRTQGVRIFCEVTVKQMALPHGELYTTEGVRGAALWIPPGKRDTSLLASLRLLPATVRAAGLKRLPLVMSILESVERKHPHEPHFYLPMLGVDPPHQGQGAGTALMKPVLERCDREGIPAYLETANERTIPLYERNGFRVTEALDLPKGGPRIWLMWRDPQ